MVGRVSKPFGLHGWSHITSFTDPHKNLTLYRPWALDSGQPTETNWNFVKDVEIRGHADGFVACIDNCESRTAASGFAGRLIGVPKDALPEPTGEEFYWVDLVDTPVVNTSGQCLGNVLEVFETGAHAVLRVGNGEKDQMIPFVRGVVLNVEPHSQIDVAWELDW